MNVIKSIERILIGLLNCLTSGNFFGLIGSTFAKLTVFLAQLTYC
jgi:hypothetical protein